MLPGMAAGDKRVVSMSKEIPPYLGSYWSVDIVHKEEDTPDFFPPGFIYFIGK